MSISDKKLSPDEYRANFQEVYPALAEDQALLESNRCVYCYDAPCTRACPTDIDVASFIKQIAQGNNRGSAKTILDANILGASCARVCPTEKLCEEVCVCNELHQKPIPIGRLQRYAVDSVLYSSAEEKRGPLYQAAAPAGKRVAVVGAGPAGLSAAHLLARAGVLVDIYEKRESGGGLMRYGVAAYKLEEDFVARELDWILSVGGIHIKYNQALGQDISLATLKEDYDAVFIGAGLGATRGLGIPGEELPGVLDALTFIEDVRTLAPGEIEIGDKVAVIGMGLTAIDSARQAIRLGAREVTMVYRRGEKEKTATEKEYLAARKEGIQVKWLAAPVEIKGEFSGGPGQKEGRLTALVCEHMRSGPVDDSGRARPEPAGEFFELNVDMVIKALGQAPLSNIAGLFPGLELERGRIKVDENCRTGLDGVFAGGDIINGGAEVVHAVQDGKIAAAAILKDLGLSLNESV